MAEDEKADRALKANSRNWGASGNVTAFLAGCEVQQSNGVIVEERDFWHVAHHLIRLHGSQAPLDAAVRAEKARLSGDEDGHSIWRLVMHKVQELQREPLPGELH